MTMEDMARALEDTGDYRILRRMQPRQHFNDPDSASAFIGIIVDVETTGTDPAGDDVIELGMIKFAFSQSGKVLQVVDEFQAFREPLLPITAEITGITGITEEMVAGHHIEEGHVSAFVSDARIIIAHNAGFDRKFCERHWRGFSEMAWGCSLNEIDWKAEGFEGQKLGQILGQIGLFHGGHRATEDCRALLEILNHTMPSGETGLAKLLASARQSTIRIWATNAPFGKKDELKARGYRWSDGSDSDHKAWWIDVIDSAYPAEMTFLEGIYGYPANLPTRRLNAFSRYSVRA